MYKSKAEIIKKKRQSLSIYNKLLVYKGKIFARNGFDEATKTYPFLTDFGSFISHSRSIFQYAYKEAKQNNKQIEYENFISSNPIIKLFKELRDTEIHVGTVGKSTLIQGESKIFLNNEEYPSREVNRISEENKKAIVSTYITKRIEVSQELIDRLKAESKTDLLDAIERGEELYEEVSLNEESDIFKLIDHYISAINKFISFGIQKGFIT